MPKKRKKNKETPTQEEIRERCLEIQSTWDEQTRRSRIADPKLRPDYVHCWSIPIINVSELDISSLDDVIDSRADSLPFRNIRASTTIIGGLDKVNLI